MWSLSSLLLLLGALLCTSEALDENCLAPAETGLCRAYFIRWNFNPATKTCEQFVYGGCPGNANNYETKEQCEASCMNANADKDDELSCSPINCNMYCEDGFEVDSQGCHTCNCRGRTTPDQRAPPGESRISRDNHRDGRKMCRKFCPYGYQQDISGETICRCSTPPQCPAIQCNMHCIYGFALNQDGCPTCDCNAPAACGEMSCTIECAQGFQLDGRGCRLCKCAGDSPTLADIKSNNLQEGANECTGVMCAMWCPNGFAVHPVSHCPVCQCAEMPRCEPVYCRMHCNFGRKVDRNGCELCACAPPPQCEPIRCSNHCPNGRKLLINKCPSCECKDEGPENICSAIACFMDCEFGFKIDDKGCKICRCLEQPEFCSAIQCRMKCPNGFDRDANGCFQCRCKEVPALTSCINLSCRKYCAHGFIKDSQNCDTCECKTADNNNTLRAISCGLISCRMHCPYGHENDVNGCHMCQCRQSPQHQCNDATCRMHCEYGFQSDEFGCNICKCKDCPAMSGCRINCDGKKKKVPTATLR